MDIFKRRPRGRSLILVLAGLLAAGAAWTFGGASVDAAKTVFGYAGSGREGIAVNLFLPGKLTVEAGDTVEWVNPYEEPHTLTYLTGGASFAFDEVANVEVADAFDGSEAFSSGFIGKDAHFSVTFEKFGTYKFLCLLHEGMTVVVNVVPAGSAIPPQGANDPKNAAITENAIALAEAAIDKLVVPAPTSNANGTQNWTVLTGPGVPLPQGSSADVMKFFAPSVKIAAGDTVTWKDDTFVPHTVTFIPPGNLPDAIDPFTPAVPSTNFDGSQYTSSGILSNVPEFGAVTSFSLTFTKPGTYQYVCLLHADQGMVGEVIVTGSATSSGGGTISPPSTGDGGLLN